MNPSPAFIEVEIERILPGGVGLAHAEGLTFFVSLAVPGDILRVRVDRIRGKIAFASIQEIKKPSPLRIEPPCPYFGLCGGCDFQQLAYDDQLKAKLEIIRDCLHRIARIESPPEIEIYPSPSTWQYRGRAHWQLDMQTGQLGYYERGSRKVCDVEYCAVLEPPLQEALGSVREMLPELPEDLREIEITSGNEGISVSPPVADFETIVVTRKIGMESFDFSAEAFFQTNHGVLEPLLNFALSGATGGIAIDLYCGVGLFTVPLGRWFTKVIGVESNSSSARFARRNIEQAQLKNTEVVTSPVASWFDVLPDSFGPVDFILLDPPRAGAENTVIEGVLKLRPRMITYVSCDPATLARDLRKLLASGYVIETMKAFDMFPQTHHVETVATLAREA